MKQYLRPAKYISIVIGLSMMITSCASIKNYKYFEDIPDSGKIEKIINENYKEPVIQSDDILYVAIQTIDPMAAAPINSLNSTMPSSYNSLLSSATITGNQSATYGYLVDKKGDIKIPIIGEVNVLGLTTSQARKEITERAQQYFKDPSVIVRFANFKITVLGEVQRPGIFTAPNEKVTILDALGYAGDLTIYGVRTNILLLRRQMDGSTTVVRLNLNNSAVLKSPYFYLQQNDEIYVEPARTKITASDASQVRNISILTGALSVLIVLLTRIK